MKDISQIKQHLELADPAKQELVERLAKLLASGEAVPPFSAAAQKLCSMVQSESTTMDDFARVISLDPGLATRCIRVASSVGFAGRPIESINQAVMLIGVGQVRRIAYAVGAMAAFSGFKGKIDWKRFWLHNILVARLTERVSSCFRDPHGMEYLAGLLHDIGKLIIERFLTADFERILKSAEERQCTHAQMEREILGLDHTQIGAAMCVCLELHPHLLRALKYHHDPLCAEHTRDPEGDGGFLAACIAVADRVANRVKGYSPVPDQTPVEQSPEWFFLSSLAAPSPFEVDVESEVAKAEKDFSAFAG